MVTAQDAIGDLPRITKHLDGEMPRGTRRFTTKVSYREDVEPNDFVRTMREWPGFESPGWVADHVIHLSLGITPFSDG